MWENIGSKGKTSGSVERQGKTSESHGRQVKAMEGKWKLWKRSGSCGKGLEVMEEGRRGWVRTRK